MEIDGNIVLAGYRVNQIYPEDVPPQEMEKLVAGLARVTEGRNLYAFETRITFMVLKQHAPSPGIKPRTKPEEWGPFWSDKAPDALYRQGEALLRLGPKYGSAAETAFERLINEYPDSPRVAEAKRQLELLGPAEGGGAGNEG